MIYQITFMYFHEQMAIYPDGNRGFGVIPKMINPWDAIKNLMEHTGDSIIWIVTDEQLPDFMVRVKKYDLEKFLIARTDGKGEGTTNFNYPDKKLRLKPFVMKGAK